MAKLEIYEAVRRPDLLEKLGDQAYDAKIERAVMLNVEAFEWNCPQHITLRYTIDEIQQLILPLNKHIEKLERRIEQFEAERK